MGVGGEWHRIGSATKAEGAHGTVIACSIHAIPINWNGEFFLFLTTKEKP